MRLTFPLLMALVATSGVAAEPSAAYARKGNLEFALRTHRVLVATKPDENTFWSPASLQAALAALGEGARGTSAAEVASLLALPMSAGGEATFADLHAFNRATAAHLGAPMEASPLAFTYEATGHLWVQQGFLVKEPFLRTLRSAYGESTVAPADFMRDAEGERLRANILLENETHGLVRDALPRGFFDPSTKLAFAHVAYLKADWAQPFQVENTLEGTFHAEGSAEVRVPLMRDRRYVSYAAFQADGTPFPTPKTVPWQNDDADPRHYPGKGGYQVVRLGYHGARASMRVLLPTAGGTLGQLEASLTSGRLASALRDADEYHCHVVLPRFAAKVEWELDKLLPSLGVKAVFDWRTADLSGMADPPPPLFVSGFIQKGRLDVNERGTIAAVVTAFGIAAGAALPDTSKPRAFEPVFIADRPFLYLIVDDLTGQLLFMGRVVRP